jgi:hypothetical protein
MFIAGGKALNAHDQGRPPAAGVLGVAVARLEHVVEELEGVQVAGMHPEDDRWRFRRRRFDLEPSVQGKFEKSLPGRQSELLGRQDRGWIIELQFGWVLDGFESIPSIHGSGSCDTIKPEEISHKVRQVLFADDDEIHFNSLDSPV